MEARATFRIDGAAWREFRMWAARREVASASDVLRRFIDAYNRAGRDAYAERLKA